MLELKYVLMLIVINLLYSADVDAIVMQAQESDSAHPQPIY